MMRSTASNPHPARQRHWAAVLLAALLPLGCDATAGELPRAASAPDTVAGHTQRHGAEHGATEHGAGHTAMEHRELAATAPTEFSIYHSATTWLDQRGSERRLRSLAGRVRVVAMVYTSCAVACPRIMLDMKRIEAELGPALADDVGFVLVSIDPERDTPERLAEFAAGSRLDPDRWTLLTGNPGDVRELAVLLGVQYRQAAPGEWIHSNLITVLDRDGEVVHRQLGLGADPTATLEAIRDMAGPA